MGFLSWLSSKKRQQSSSRKSTPPRRRSRFLKPALENLESRLAPANFTWTGTGANTKFSTGGNWMSGTAPTGSPTDDLVFPVIAASASKAPNNDLTGATFNSITFQGSGYTL